MFGFGKNSLDIAKEIVPPIAKKYGIIRVYLFGSRARGDNRKSSDYDFCILIPEEMTLLKLVSFHEEVSEALGSKVDFAYEDEMSEPFFRSIRDDMRLVYEC